jgi:hypothetical protein
MDVAHGLAAVSAGVKHDPVARIGDPLGDGDFMRMGCEVGQKTVADRRELGQIGVVGARDNEHMYRCLRIDIAECDRPLGARNYRRRYLGGGYSAKQALRHAVDLNVCPASNAADIYGCSTANPRCTTPLVQRPRQFLASVAQGLVMRGRCERIGCGCGGKADREASGSGD